jgi:phospholipid/cholesterol/gamma-HCH transport system substrate-binding protein
VISRTVRLQLLVFVLITVLGIAYAGFTYVGIRTIFGWHFVPGPYTVRVHLTDSGGIFTNAQVTERGAEVGRVGALHLEPGGVEVDLKINHGVKISQDVTAQVADLSAVGEQYVDLTPQADGGPYLTNDSSIARSRTSVPIDDATLLRNIDQLVNSVDATDLKTVISQLGTAFDDTGPDLQRLIDQGNALLASAQQALPQTLGLINDGKTVLDTQNALRGDLTSFSHNLNLLSQQLVSSDPSLRSLLDNGVTASQTLTGVLKDNEANLPTLLNNFVTLGAIAERRLPQVETLLVAYPPVVANTFQILRPLPDGKTPTAQFGLVTSTSPPSCLTGYQSTVKRHNQTAADGGGAANLNTLCLPPNAAPSGTSDARGAQTAPRPAGDNTGQAGGAVGTTTSSSTPSYFTIASYDPGDQTYTLSNGTQYSIGTAGFDSTLFGRNSWMYLLTTGFAD